MNIRSGIHWTKLAIALALLCSMFSFSALKAEPLATSKNKYYMAELTIRERPVGNVIILDLEGKITEGGGTAALRNAIGGSLDEGKANILLNLKGVSEADESGVGELVASYTATDAKGGKLKLLNLPKFFSDLLMVTKFLTVFQIYDNEDEAIASFS